MSSSIRNRSRTVWDTISSVGVGLAGQFSVLVSGTIAARLLGVEDRGHLALFFVISIVLAQLGSVGLPLAVTFRIAADTHSANRILAVLRKVIPLQIVIVTVLSCVAVYLVVADLSHQVRIAGFISILTPGATLLQQYALSALQGLRRFASFNVLRLLPVAGFALTALAAWIFNWDSLIDVTIAWTSATVFAAVVTACWLWYTWDSPPIDPADDDSRLLASMFGFGARGLLGSSSPVETLRADQAAVGLFLSPAALGLYVTAIAFTNLPKFIAQSVGMVAYPNVAREPEIRTARATMWRFTLATGLACGAVVLALEGLVGVLLPFLFGPEFDGAVSVSRILLVAAFFVSMRRILSDGARGIGKPGAGTTAELVSVACLAPILVVTVGIGLDAVAWGMVAAAVLSFVLLVVLVVRPNDPNAVRAPVRIADASS